MKTIITILTFLFFSAQTFEAQTLVNQTMVHDGYNREYAIYIPASYDGNQQVPLLFNFHGGGGNIVDYMSAVDMRPIADTANFLLVYPKQFQTPEMEDPQAGCIRLRQLLMMYLLLRP